MTTLSVFIIVAVLGAYFVFASGAWVSIVQFFKKRKPESPKPQSVQFRDGSLYYPPATHTAGQVVTGKIESPVARVSETLKQAVLSNHGVGARVRPTEKPKADEDEPRKTSDTYLPSADLLDIAGWSTGSSDSTYDSSSSSDTSSTDFGGGDFGGGGAGSDY